MDKTFRHEYKHYINYSDYLAIRNNLKVLTKPDKNVDENGRYFIRSLYFDNYRDKALREKIDGVNNREKFRIRYYNYDESFIMLEKKSKIHDLCKKNSAPITKEECEKILCSDISWMKDDKRELLVELYGKMLYQLLRPRTIVDYIREPYIYRAGNVRITFDSNIRTGLYSTDIFLKDLPTITTEDNTIIMEVKYDAYLPEIIKEALQIKTTRCTAFSKYAVCRKFG